MLTEVDQRIQFPVTASTATSTLRSSNASPLSDRIKSHEKPLEWTEYRSRYLKKAEELMDQKLYDAAIAAFSRAVSDLEKKKGENGSRIKALYRRAECFMLTKQFQRAVEDLTKVIAETPSNGRFFLQRAQAYGHLKEFHLALKDYEQVELFFTEESSSGSRNPLPGQQETIRSTHFAKALVYKEMNNTTLALRELSQAESLDQRLFYVAQIAFVRSKLYLKSHQKRLALLELNKYVEIDRSGTQMDLLEKSDFIDVLLARADILVSLAKEEEVKALSDLNSRSMEDGECFASFPLKQSEWDSPPFQHPVSVQFVERALEDYTELLALDPEDTHVLRLRAETYALVHAFEKSLCDLETARALDPHDFDTIMAIAKIQGFQSEWNEAIASMNHILDENPEYIAALFLRGKLFERIESLTHALADYTRIIDTQHLKVEEAMESEGWISKKKGQKSRETDAQGKTTSDGARALLLRARIFVVLEDFEAALTDYSRILDSFPNHLDAQLEQQSTQEAFQTHTQAQAEQAISWLLAQDQSVEAARKKKKKKKKARQCEILQDAPKLLEPIEAIQTLPPISREQVWDTVEDSPKSQTTTASRVVLMDEKYLRKRQKQLENLRKELQFVTDAETLSGVLERVERKQMTEQLADEIAQAKRRSSEPKAQDFVHRPIDYTLAMREIELEEALQAQKTEIAHLRAQLDKCHCSTHSDALPQRISLPLRLSSRVETSVKKLIHALSPTHEADQARCNILAYLRHLLELQFPRSSSILFFPTGSFPCKTYLPDADLDVCLLVPRSMEPTWFFSVVQMLCFAATNDVHAEPKHSLESVQAPSWMNSTSSTGNTVRNVTFINADVRVVKCTIDNVAVDITVNRVGALGALVLLDTFDLRVGRHHLFKQSLVLIKAWCALDCLEGGQGCGVLGSKNGAFSTYAVNTMVMTLFNRWGYRIQHPLEALHLFLDIMTQFPWQECAWTIFGPVLFTQLYQNLSSRIVPPGWETASANCLITREDIEQIRVCLNEYFGSFDVSLGTETNAVFPLRSFNMIDPLQLGNNLARSVLPEIFPSLQVMFRDGRDRLDRVLSEEKTVMEFFKHSWKLYGRGDGWRPDLLLHPRQLWVQANGRDEKDESGSDTKWKSLIPEYLRPCRRDPGQNYKRGNGRRRTTSPSYRRSSSSGPAGNAASRRLHLDQHGVSSPSESIG
uniref:Uncharacterized protein AlNc14C213G8959 n=1 Tax=Albugo laibachii Nc14 TaxID=890382 RepID=F0WRF6_9STRA|nr:conserved hypothetical protein [Albugo laibachii Nc14]|eukprot:CCA23919.1 conserved hypothetical protein [Albugo laibachii Nc14]